MITNPQRRYEARPMPDDPIPGTWAVYDTRTDTVVYGEKSTREEWAKARALALNHAWERTLP